MNKLFDLRFVIGAFFTIVGLMLLIYAFTSGEPDGQKINRWCGITFMIFGLLMVIFSFQKDAKDEILEEGKTNVPH